MFRPSGTHCGGKSIALDLRTVILRDDMDTRKMLVLLTVSFFAPYKDF